MAIAAKSIQDVTAALYERSLKRIPEDAKQALRDAGRVERNETAQSTLSRAKAAVDAIG